MEAATGTQDIYAPKQLDPTRRETRILSVTQSPDRQLLGHLRVASLNDTLKYSALSYVWGDPNVTSRMQLDGVEKTITQNLREALDQLATEGKAENIWVDAVCINQADAEEKKHHIQFMEEVYSKAEVTYIWLGEAADTATDKSDLAMDLISDIKGADFEKYNPQAPEWKGIESLFQRPWWTRMWVLQESLLSPSPIVKCGIKEVKLEKFVDFNYLFDEYLRKDTVRFSSLAWFCEIPYRDMLWRDMGKWLDGFLGSWLPYVGRFKCTVLRDRVYSLLGMVQKASRKGINVDYTTKPGTRDFVKSDEEVLSEATALLFEETGEFILRYVGGEKGDELKLPSWCPDWTRHQAFVQFSPLGYSAYIPGKIKNESEIKPWLREGTSVANSDILRFSPDKRTLGVRGFLVDTIDFSDKTLDGTAKERAHLTLEACKRWESHVSSHKTNSYDTSGGWLEAFWRTVIADRDRSLNPKAAPSTMKSNFDAWMGRPDPRVSMAGEERFAFEKEYSYPAMAMCRKRSFFTTTKGYFGLALQEARVGDWVCVLRGLETPFILRPAKNENYSIIAEAYVHGIMNGEILETVDVNDLREFWLE